MIYIASTSRLRAHVNMLIAQGLLLFLVCLAGFEKEPWFNLSMLSGLDAIKTNMPHIIGFLFVVVETLIVKAFVIPLFLRKVVNRTNAHRDTDANIPHFYCLVISSVILFAGFLIANINLWLITIKHKVLSNVIGFITMENGIFLLSLAVAHEMPVIVNLGVLLDIFIAVFILGMLVNEISNEFEGLEVSQLSDLKDYDYND